MRRHCGRSASAAAALMLALAACQDYVRPLETGAADELNPLVDSVVAARNAQANLREQVGFASANFAAVATVEPEYVEFEDAAGTHRKLSSNYRLVQARAAGLRERIERMVDAGESTFDAWHAALDDYPDAAARRVREQRLAATRSAYEDLLRSTRRAEQSVEPLFDVYSDHVDALGRRASEADLRNLRADLDRIEARTNRAVERLEEAVAMADAFVASIQDDLGAADRRDRTVGTVP